ncbi:hypothetical protein [Actinomadura sp. HBU206391]|uniref:hypothetical protein n=1 Tax=Actinomadura sp. HBU206391 TaxID=2731692 RepID=UPI0016501A03|nr:hypothetical protein [Actinomadura sp. HBU206391]MBC6456948.1 hypothetical protein [Actinomadura sp. HBU206391]
MRRHRFDPGSLLAGLLFLAVAGVYLAGGFGDHAVVPAEILVPAVFIGLGVVGLVRVLTRSRRREP